tara:strand:- start:8389 stop:9624 length:1236 start_codon:yes stop_codon:yes gene_type:complete
MAIYDNASDKSIVNLNSVGSQYASDFSHDTSILVEKITNKAIFDASPQQFMDLKLLNMKPSVPVNSDEFFYQEMDYQRKVSVAASSPAGVTYPTTQAITLTSVDDIAEDYVIVYPNNKKGIVTDVNTTTKIVTITPLNGDTVPTVTSGDNIHLLSPVEADGADGFANMFRATTTERYNYVQLFSKTIRYGEVELYKLQKAAATDNFIEMEKNAMFSQFRTDISNAFWNGEKGEAILANGDKAKLTQGVYPAMVAAGSPNASATLATLKESFEDTVLDTEFGEYGAVRMAFATPKIILKLSKQYKDTLTRYTPNDEIAKLGLKEIDLGSSRIVLVPYSRFGSDASFPAAFANRIFIVDMKNITLRSMWGERSGETLDRVQGVPKRYKEMWVDANYGVQFNNPLACGYIDVTL